MSKKLFSVLAVLSLVVAAACGSSGSSDNSGNSGSVSGDTAATASAATGVATSSTTDAATSLGQSVNNQAVEQTKQSILNYIVSESADEIIYQMSAPDFNKEVTAAWNDDYSEITLTFDDEVVIVGDGTVTLNGTLSFTYTQVDSNTGTLTAQGDLTCDVLNATDTVVIDGESYTETLNGTMTLTFSGSFTATLNDDYDLTSLESDLTATIAGEDLIVTGDAAGTVTEMEVTSNVTGDGTNPSSLTVTCSGSVTVTTDAGTETCTIASDCTGCQ